MNLYHTRFKPLGFASQSPIINLGKGKFIYAAHLNWHMAETNCMSFESSKYTFHQWQETRNLHSMLCNQSHIL